jgi:hypothetical protein
MFIVIFTSLALVTGLIIGAVPSDWGMLASGALYGFVALLLGVVFQRTVFLIGEGW